MRAISWATAMSNLEPSIGLHPRDIGRLIRVLHRLRDAGNTLVVVEHDPEVIRAADLVLDLGPGPGERGGEVVFFGSLKQLARSRKCPPAKNCPHPPTLRMAGWRSLILAVMMRRTVQQAPVVPRKITLMNLMPGSWRRTAPWSCHGRRTSGRSTLFWHAGEESGASCLRGTAVKGTWSLSPLPDGFCVHILTRR